MQVGEYSAYMAAALGRAEKWCSLCSGYEWGIAVPVEEVVRGKVLLVRVYHWVWLGRAARLLLCAVLHTVQRSSLDVLVCKKLAGGKLPGYTQLDL